MEAMFYPESYKMFFTRNKNHSFFLHEKAIYFFSSYFITYLKFSLKTAGSDYLFFTFFKTILIYNNVTIGNVLSSLILLVYCPCMFAICFCVCACGLFEWKRTCSACFYCSLISVFSMTIQLSKSEGWDSH
jgi:hypothetical protein